MKLRFHFLLFLIIFSTNLLGQPDVQPYLKNNIRIYYLAEVNTKTLDFREIKPGNLSPSGNGIIFGSTDNNQMDTSARFLSDLFNTNGDAAFQQSVYDGLKKINKTIVIGFLNDAVAGIDSIYLPQYGIHNYYGRDKGYVWPASYSKWTKISDAPYPAIVMGERYNRNKTLAELKNIFNGMLEDIAMGAYGAADPGKRTADKYTVRTVTMFGLPNLTKTQEDLWTRADVQQLGVIGSDFVRNEEIGTAPVEREMKLGLGNPQFLNFWYPNTRRGEKKAFKQTMIGKLSGSEHFDNDIIFPDHDIDFYVIPEPEYKFLIDESNKPNAHFLTRFGQIKDLLVSIYHLDPKWESCPDVFTEVEAEIELNKIREKQFPAFFNEEMKTSVYAGFYGVWLWDAGHCEHPEIHPAEQIWWRRVKENVTTYHCNLICDYSGRYNLRSQYDDESGKYSILRPWAEAPIDGVFAIPFNLKPGVEKAVFRIIGLGSNNLNANNSVLFDPYKVHHYVLNGQPIVSVIEPDVESVLVSFQEVGIGQNGEIKGFVVIKSSVGMINADKSTEPGHLFLEIKKSILKINQPANPPGKIKVTMESIECIAVNDKAKPDLIFGLVLPKAYAVKDSNVFNVEKLPYTSNLGTSHCQFGEETLFCLDCSHLLEFRTGTKSTFGGAFTYDFPTDGYLEISSNLQKAPTGSCGDIAPLGVPVKTVILTNELGVQPYSFSQLFASGGTIMKINFKVQKIK